MEQNNKPENIAIDFAEWIALNYWKHIDEKDGECFWYDGNKERKTSELFNEFLLTHREKTK